MKTLIVLALFALLAVSCYMGDATGLAMFGVIQIAAIAGLAASLVKQLKLI